MDKKKTKKVVKEAYGRIAKGGKGCGCGTCTPDAGEYAKGLGYSEKELSDVPEGANLGLSCGNPTAMAGLKEGDVVLDLGSGAGFDSFLAASKVGPRGRVVGVDMTPEMIAKAKENAKRNGITNVEFKLGEIEKLPLADNSVDVVISNCVINLSADKPRVFKEIRRVLKPGGRISISDIALKKELPPKVRKSVEAYVGCVAGAVLVEEYKRIVEAAGLEDVKISITGSSACITPDTNDPIASAILENLGENETLEECVVSVLVEGRKRV